MNQVVGVVVVYAIRMLAVVGSKHGNDYFLFSWWEYFHSIVTVTVRVNRVVKITPTMQLADKEKSTESVVLSYSIMLYQSIRVAPNSAARMSICGTYTTYQRSFLFNKSVHCIYVSIVFTEAADDAWFLDIFNLG